MLDRAAFGVRVNLPFNYLLRGNPDLLQVYHKFGAEKVRKAQKTPDEYP